MSAVEGLDVILQAGHVAEPEHSCRAWVGVPLIQPVQIFVAGDGEAAEDARELADAIATLIAEIAPAAFEAEPPCGGVHCATECAAQHDARVRKLLAWVGTADSPSDESESFAQAWRADGHDALAVLPRGSEHNVALPVSLRELHTEMWDSAVTQAAYAVLVAAAVVDPENRVFVSYRHSEGGDLAREVFHVLTEHRFDVFLDRFSLEPAADFKERIEQELVDKAFVIVVETNTVEKSEWIEHEVGFARTHGLGVAAVNAGAPAAFGIAEAQRLRLGRGDFDGAPPKLSDVGRDRLVQHVQKLHGLTLADRRRRLQESLRLELARSIDPARIRRARGGVDVDGQPPYAIDVCTRPPRLEDYRTVGRRADGASATAALVGPAAVAADRVDALAWLESESAVRRWDEGDLALLANHVAAGGGP